MPKEEFKPLSQEDRAYKMLYAGDAGTGKTWAACQYDVGPVHIYAIDKNCKQTVSAYLRNAKRTHPISIDDLSANDISFVDIANALKKDANDGFFIEMAEKKGLIILDSLTSLDQKCSDAIANAHGLSNYKITAKPLLKPFTPAHYGQMGDWMRVVISSIQNLPCSAVCTVHTVFTLDASSMVVSCLPTITGSKLKAVLPSDFDIVGHYTKRGSVFEVRFHEYKKFKALSRCGADIIDPTKVYSYDLEKPTKLDDAFNINNIYKEKQNVV